MSKIAVMGDYDSVYGFGALGLDIYRVTDAEEGAALLKKLAEGEYGVVYMTQVVFRHKWEDYYGFNRGGKWPVSFAVMLIATALLSLLLASV